jgi:hypothetical protein
MREHEATSVPKGVIMASLQKDRIKIPGRENGPPLFPESSPIFGMIAQF